MGFGLTHIVNDKISVQALEGDSHIGLVSQSRKYVPLRDENTPAKLKQERELIKQSYLASEKVLFDYESTAGLYTIGSSAGTYSLDTTKKESGKSSLKITTNDTEYFVGKNSTWDFSQETHFRLWVTVDDYTKLAELMLVFNAPDFNNQFITINLKNHITKRYGSAIEISISKSEFTTYGAPNWNNSVSAVFVRVKATTGNTVTVWVDNIKAQKSKVRGKVILRLDDAYKSQYEFALPALTKYGLPIALVVNPEFVKSGIFSTTNYPVMTVNQLKEFQTFGCDICSHTWNHAPHENRTYQQAYHDLRATQNWLIENGFSAGARVHAYGGHGHNEDTLKAANDLFLLDSSGISGFETLPWSESNLRWRSGDKKDFETLKQHVDSASINKSLVILTFHRFEAGGADYTTDPTVFETFISHLASRTDIDVITYSDLIDRTAVAMR